MHLLPGRVPDGKHNGIREGHQGADAREEMLALFRGYLQGLYPDWDERDLVYSKWKGMKYR